MRCLSERLPVQQPMQHVFDIMHSADASMLSTSRQSADQCLRRSGQQGSGRGLAPEVQTHQGRQSVPCKGALLEVWAVRFLLHPLRKRRMRLSWWVAA